MQEFVTPVTGIVNAIDITHKQGLERVGREIPGNRATPQTRPSVPPGISRSEDGVFCALPQPSYRQKLKKLLARCRIVGVNMHQAPLKGFSLV